MSEHSLLPQIETKKFDAFEVDYYKQLNDIVYHFYPIGGDDFENGFHLQLEKAFASVLPDDADVRADYFSLRETSNFDRASGGPVKTSSFCVQVIGWANNPLADKFLKNKVFENLQEYTTCTS
tara:strand:- start:2643 stop:3011 length:369 start_codon:yes stop_codon:yes gene_type:complete